VRAVSYPRHLRPFRGPDTRDVKAEEASTGPRNMVIHMLYLLREHSLRATCHFRYARCYTVIEGVSPFESESISAAEPPPLTSMQSHIVTTQPLQGLS
jgi:hypothetical protein